MTTKAACVAYILQAQDESGYVKVGMTSDIDRRMKQLRTALPFTLELVALFANGKQTESEMKDLLAPWQTRGEWFQPRVELNSFIAAKRKHNMVLERVEVDEAYSNQFIKPVVLAYLAGREPLFNAAGDFVYRFIHEGIKIVGDRHWELVGAVKAELSYETLQGLVPLREGLPTPAIRVPDLAAATKQDMAQAS